MNPPKPFDLLSSPLEGTNLIEAGAGTGKTYAIAGLFLRLLLEKNLSVDEILVVTFTQAATEELRDRIRRKIREAMDAFAQGATEDGFLQQLVQKQSDSAEAVRRLGEALRGFDEAAISTIHGFCHRMLFEKAFESGTLFETELVTDEETLKREACDDFWRTHVATASALFVHYVTRHNVTPESLRTLLANRVDQPYLRIVPVVEKTDSDREEKAFTACFRKVQQTWPSARKDVEAILLHERSLNRNMYKQAKIPEWLEAMDRLAASRGQAPFLFDNFHKFTTTHIAGAVKKDGKTPEHLFFDLCDALQRAQEALDRAFSRRLLHLKTRLFHEVRAALTGKKREKNVQTFADLLWGLRSALAGRGGERLSRAVRARFKAALIDEFQDTDPVQYAIFKEIFGQEESQLFFIGDPKQAIYGFRGADVFAYMEAARDASTRYTLRENWRSEPRLITAINTLFSESRQPFVYDEIPFQPAGPAKAKDSEILRVDGRHEPPFQMWFLGASDASAPGKPVSKTVARDRIAEAVAAEISRLLKLAKAKRAILGGRPLSEGDMAVMVRRNDEATLMQEALSTLRIPSVLYTTRNLFDSHEAMETERVLAALVEPSNEILSRAALATDMMGYGGEGLDALMEDEENWEARLMQFRRYHELWQERGFIRMFRTLLSEEGVLERLIRLLGGERRNTNMLHLMEVLHQISVERKLTRAGVLKWLSEQRAPETRRREEHQLRLESDEKAVRVVTIHRSKGLEYPVVFCPFVWDRSDMKKTKDPITFHHEKNGMRLTLDLGSAQMDENRPLAEKEQLAENLRLLYVALTRAKCRVYLVWGRFNEAETSAPAYLLHAPPAEDGKNTVRAIGEHVKSLGNEALWAGLRKVVDKAQGSMALYSMPEGPGEARAPVSREEAPLAARPFGARIDRRWKISSFSSLTSGSRHGEELADRDAWLSPVEEEAPALEDTEAEKALSGIFAFPKGTKAGVFLHDLLEHLDFTSEHAASIKRLVLEKLVQHGFEEIWLDTILNMVQKVLSVPLELEQQDFSLSRISNGERLNEVEFYFPLKLITPADLEKIDLRAGQPQGAMEVPERVGRLEFAPVRGYMKGFMDLVFRFEDRFYLVDWKSNFLGSRVEDYDGPRMAAAMAESFYTLQYHLYTVALHQYLKVKQPGYDYGKHFGGVYYVFLRGVDPDKGPQYGVFRDRPSQALIEDLCGVLIEG
jgi:exodeoxyribonuclease V beta subunit